MRAQKKPVRVEIDELRRRLQEAEETLEAIRSGEVDALVVSSDCGEKVFTLRGAEHPYRILVESISEGAATLTPDGVVLFCNVALARMVGTPLEQVMGKPLYDFIVPAEIARVRDLIGAAFRSAIREETRLVHPDGSIPVQLSLNPVTLDERPAIAAILVDLTERIGRERAQEAVRTRDEFITIASHELRTPLSALTLQLGMAERSLTRGDHERTGKSIAKARSQALRIAALVDRLLDVSRIAGGRLILEVEEHDLGEIVREAAARFSEEAESAGSVLRVSAPSGLLARVDRSRIDQAISNLISNAVKYGASSEIHVTLEERDGAVEIHVQDHGIGMEPEELERVFDRFERGAGAATYGGLGLGLYITREIVAQHGGTVRARSSRGAGSRFTLELPLPSARKRPRR